MARKPPNSPNKTVSKVHTEISSLKIKKKIKRIDYKD